MFYKTIISIGYFSFTQVVRAFFIYTNGPLTITIELPGIATICFHALWFRLNISTIPIFSLSPLSIRAILRPTELIRSYCTETAKQEYTREYILGKVSPG